MTLYGYARVSTAGQDLSLQEAALRQAGCQVIRSEKRTGTQREGRAELDILLQFLRAGDTLVITRIDRLARSLKDLQDIVHELKARGVTLRATEQPVDTATAAGKAFLDMLGVFAEFETNLRRERQMKGIAAAKVGGVYKGRRPTIDPGEVRRLHEQERLSSTDGTRRLGIADRRFTGSRLDLGCLAKATASHRPKHTRPSLNLLPTSDIGEASLPLRTLLQELVSACGRSSLTLEK